jgi:hypothetical protein
MWLPLLCQTAEINKLTGSAAAWLCHFLTSLLGLAWCWEPETWRKAEFVESSNKVSTFTLFKRCQQIINHSAVWSITLVLQLSITFVLQLSNELVMVLAKLRSLAWKCNVLYGCRKGWRRCPPSQAKLYLWFSFLTHLTVRWV